MDTVELEQDFEEVFLDFAEAAIEHIVYPDCDGDTRKDLLQLAEQVLRYLLLLSNNDGEFVWCCQRFSCRDGGK